MLEVRRGLSVRSYENTFFREFAQNLSLLFDRYDLEGVLIGNSICAASENLQIDGLLIVNNTLCIIDFKNYGGVITLPDHKDFMDSVWTNESGDLVKGGSHINPYKQLAQQKKALVWVYHNSPLKTLIAEYGDSLNPSHTKRIVCFQHPIELVGTIPRKDELDFFITDKNRYLEVIKDIIDVTDGSISLSDKSFTVFKDVFKADPFELNEVYGKDELITNEIVEFEPVPEPILEVGSTKVADGKSLFDDQEVALQRIKQFLSTNDEKVLILEGSSQSGKSYLIPHIKDTAFRQGFAQVELLATSYKVIKNLLHDADEFSSMYGYIYGGSSQFVAQEESTETDNDNVRADEAVDDGTDGFLEIIPVKICEDEDKTLYVIDEAHLLSNSFVQSLVKQFGTGRVLADFIDFINLDGSNRKVIFIGDQYHMVMGKKDENALNPILYNTQYSLSTVVCSLNPKKGDDITAQARRLIDGIDNKQFNNLSFDYGDSFALLDRSEIRNLITKNLKNDFKILNYTNKACSAVNLWIKKSILRNGEILTTNDLVLINNNVDAIPLDNSINPTKRIFNGDFAWVDTTSESTSYTIGIRNKNPITLSFKNLTLKLCDSGEIVDTCYLENYLVEDLTDDTRLAIKILINQKLNELLTAYPFDGSEAKREAIASKEYQDQLSATNELEVQSKNGERVATKLKQAHASLKRILKKAARYHKRDCMRLVRTDTSSDYFKLSNSLHLRYGWCITVNKAMSYRWDSILLDANAEHRGTTNDAYYRWLYSGITRANRKVNIINIETISPFDNIIIDDKPTGKTAPPYLVLDGSVKKDMPSLYGFLDNEFLSITVQIYDYVNKILADSGLSVKGVRHNNYQEIYDVTDGASTATVNFSYKKNGQVAIKSPTGGSDELNSRVAGMFANAKGSDDFAFVTPLWKAACYKDINKGLSLAESGLSIKWVNESDYKDSIKISDGESYLVADLNYNNVGVFSKVVMTAYSDDTVKSTFTGVLESLMSKGSDSNG